MTTTPSYPIRIRTTARMIDSLSMAEEGRWEDSQAHPDEGTCEVYEVCGRAIAARSSILEIRTPEEAADTYYAVCSGTFQLYHFAVACRIADALREAVRAHDPDMVRQWRAPSGD